MSHLEDEMRAIDCPCGHHFEAVDDDELFVLCREHIDADHPEMQRTDEQTIEFTFDTVAELYRCFGVVNTMAGGAVEKIYG